MIPCMRVPWMGSEELFVESKERVKRAIPDIVLCCKGIFSYKNVSKHSSHSLIVSVPRR